MKSEKELEKLENEIAELRAEVQLLKEFKADYEKQMKILSKYVENKSSSPRTNQDV